jgi:hypothetical protein
MTVVDQSGTPAILDELVKEAHAALADGVLSFGEVVHLGGVLAGKVSQFVHLSGKQKQDLVIQAIELALDKVLSEQKDVNDEFHQKIRAAAAFAKETLPSVLTLAVQASKGQINLLKPEIRQSVWNVVCSVLRCACTPAPEVPKSVEMVVRKIHEAPKEAATHPVDEPKVEEVRPASTESQ